MTVSATQYRAQSEVKCLDNPPNLKNTFLSFKRFCTLIIKDLVKI